MKKIVVYKTVNGKEPFNEWLFSLKDKTSRLRIHTRIRRIEDGNYGDYKKFLGLIEIRFDFGKGYRIYCVEDRQILVILLIGGDKDSQAKDINKALLYAEDYYEQKKTKNI
ncbi:MAG: hypothetical protein A3J83_04220 [Elusimicrobia bacterium RIFOXYA2_FULL_40_6]|nr:MAG: hypothetical protein A3J83_04220 [Elusimicrobia bacterium RIFOXYA2_FULL_40_6]